MFESSARQTDGLRDVRDRAAVLRILHEAIDGVLHGRLSASLCVLVLLDAWPRSRPALDGLAMRAGRVLTACGPCLLGASRCLASVMVFCVCALPCASGEQGEHNWRAFACFYLAV